jgi:hypothetical protein
VFCLQTAPSKIGRHFLSFADSQFIFKSIGWICIASAAVTCHIRPNPHSLPHYPLSPHFRLIALIHGRTSYGGIFNKQSTKMIDFSLYVQFICQFAEDLPFGILSRLWD